MSWYEEFIEEPVIGLVKYLRNNGVNTVCSCGHDMYIQCQYIPDNDHKRIYDLIYCYLHENKIPINFEIKFTTQVLDGCPSHSLEIKLMESSSNGMTPGC